MKRIAVDFSAVVEGRCPICGKAGCLRELTPYERGVVSLFPYRADRVEVARFLCRKTGRTVSLLPLELAPYHEFTIPSMLTVMLLCLKTARPRSAWSILAALLDAVRGTDRVTLSLLRCWILLFLRGFHRTHRMLAEKHDLDGVCSASGLAGGLSEIAGYLRGCHVRGPPEVDKDVMALLREYSTGTQRFLVGIPSQDRSRG